MTTSSPGPDRAPGPRPAFSFDAGDFAANYNRLPFQFEHTLAGHPMLELAQLTRLARRLPAAHVHQHRADVTMGDDFYNAAATHPTHRGIEDTLAHIDAVGSYVMLRDPGVDAEFGAFLEPLWREIGLHVDRLDPGRTDPMAFVFVASPHAVTPFHVDRVANFHLQIQGEKTIHLWDPADREVLREEDLARCVAEPRDFHAPFRPEFMNRAKTFRQRPGIGVHHPWGAPHAVENGAQVSVSLAVTFRSREMKRRMGLHEFNHRLRRRGLDPGAVGQSAWRDGLKSALWRGYCGARDALRGSPAQTY